MSSYCSNFYGSAKCHNKVTMFGDRCRMCMTTKEGLPTNLKAQFQLPPKCGAIIVGMCDCDGDVDYFTNASTSTSATNNNNSRGEDNNNRQCTHHQQRTASSYMRRDSSGSEKSVDSTSTAENEEDEDYYPFEYLPDR